MQPSRRIVRLEGGWALGVVRAIVTMGTGRATRAMGDGWRTLGVVLSISIYLDLHMSLACVCDTDRHCVS